MTAGPRWRFHTEYQTVSHTIMERVPVSKEVEFTYTKWSPVERNGKHGHGLDHQAGRTRSNRQMWLRHVPVEKTFAQTVMERRERAEEVTVERRRQLQAGRKDGNADGQSLGARAPREVTVDVGDCMWPSRKRKCEPLPARFLARAKKPST